MICALFSNDILGRIDNDEFKDNGFDDERQPEVAIWSPKPDVGLYIHLRGQKTIHASILVHVFCQFFFKSYILVKLRNISF